MPPDTTLRVILLYPVPLGNRNKFPQATPYAILPVSNRQLTEPEVRALATLYWPEDEVDHAVLIADLESGFWTGAHNLDAEDSRGLWQINLLAHPQLGQWNLFDPQVNAYFAHQIWKDADSWSPWYNSAKALHLL